MCGFFYIYWLEVWGEFFCIKHPLGSQCYFCLKFEGGSSAAYAFSMSTERINIGGEEATLVQAYRHFFAQPGVKEPIR